MMIPERATRTALLRALFTVPGARFEVCSAHTAFVHCPPTLVAEAKRNVLMAANIKGFGVTLGRYDAVGFSVITDKRT